MLLIQTIKFISSNKKTTTVSKNGTITAKKVGTAKIKVTVKAGKTKKTTWMKIKVRSVVLQERKRLIFMLFFRC